MWVCKKRMGSSSVTFRVGLACWLTATCWLVSSISPGPVHAEPALARDLRPVVDSFELSNNYGKTIALHDFEDKPLIVLAFLGTECPLAKLYGPRLDELQQKFGDQGVQVIGINSNKQDSLTELTAYVHRSQISFPMLKDVGNKLADAVGATRTPEVLLLDRHRQVRYHGRIDDQYGVGVARPAAQREDLVLAIEELLAGKPVSQAETASVGCYIGRVKAVESAGDVTYTKHIAPIFNANCVECHRTGEIGPFTLTSYEDILGWEDTILEVIADNRMPPWNANPAYGHFKNDARLSASESELIRQWIAGGMPAGDLQDLPEPPQFVEGWKIGKPDQVIYMNDAPFTVPAQGTVDYQRFVVDPGWTEDKYIDAAEARPDNRGVVHHILAFIIPPGSRRVDLQTILVGYAPGSLPVQLEDGLALHVPAGSKLLFEMHYTPNGSQQVDRSYIGVRFTSQDKVSKLLQGQAVLERNFEIPAGAETHEVTADYRSKQDEMLISMTPHMHLRGKAFRYQAIYPDGSQEILLDVPKYDFNWQLKYILAEPKKLPRGTRVVCTAVFDNSAANLANPDPSRAVRWGDQSWQEMMIGFFDTVAVD
jgi:peroxiredoxin